MKVILLENISKIGSIGDIIDVKRGFARNYLISKKKALFASKKNVLDVEKIKKELASEICKFSFFCTLINFSKLF